MFFVAFLACLCCTLLEKNRGRKVKMKSRKCLESSGVKLTMLSHKIFYLSLSFSISLFHFLSHWKMVFQRGRKQILRLTASYLSRWKMVFQRGRKKREAPFYSQSEFTGFKVNSASNFEISTFNQTNMTNWARICISYKKTIENWTS